MATSQVGLDLRDVMCLFDRTAALVSSAGDVDECMARALELVCDFTGWPLGHAYRLDPETAALRPTDIWHRGDAPGQSPFVEATSRTALPAGSGLPGRAGAAGKALWSADLRGDPRESAAVAAGIAAEVAVPIASAQRIDGVLDFFPASTERPPEMLLEVVSRVGLDLGAALEVRRLRDEVASDRAWLTIAERLGRMGTWRYQVDRDRVQWSEELYALHGADPDTTPPSLEQYLARVHRDDAERVSRAIRLAIESRRGFDVEYRLVTRPDDVRWAHARGEFLPVGTSGQTPMLVGYCQDITEQKLRLEALQRGREQLAEAERQANLGSWSWDLTTGAVVASEALVRIFGGDPATSNHGFDALFALVHPDDQPHFQAQIRHTVDSGVPFDHEFRIMRADGQQRWVHSHGEVVERADGLATRVAGFAQDITERRLAEEERARLESMLHQSQRLESLGQLAGGVAHDFNNLLSAILSYASFVTEELDTKARMSSEPLYGELLADVMQISRAAERAAELTRRLLAFGRREVVRPVALLINDVVRDVEQLLRRALGAHIELVTSLQPDLWAVRADPGQLEQVLVNLAVNARDAMPGGGRLAIETANVDLDDHSAQRWPTVRPGRYVRLRFSDNGDGMTAQVADRAFEPFFTTKAKGEGSGLGLATVHGIFAQAGGGVRIDSTPGGGTVVTGVWPATDVPITAAAAAVEAEEPQASGQVVLVVDDEAALREAARRILERRGYRVLTAAAGEQAIAIAASHEGPIDLLVTDIIMPRMLGKDVAAAVTEVRPGVRVIFMSGYARSALSAESLQPGVLLLEKPFSEGELVGLVRRALGGPRRRPGSPRR